MTQDTFAIISYTSSQTSHRRRLIQVSLRIGIFLVAAVLLVMIQTFIATPSAHASGCWSSNTWSQNATSQEGQNPILYRNGQGGPRLGMLLNSCNRQFVLKWSRTICFEGCAVYYQFDWKRPGYDTWQTFTVEDHSSNAYQTSPFTNVQMGTYYNFAVRSCFKSSGRCEAWSPTVGIYS